MIHPEFSLLKNQESLKFFISRGEVFCSIFLDAKQQVSWCSTHKMPQVITPKFSQQLTYFLSSFKALEVLTSI
jgi:hypothetical protein